MKQLITIGMTVLALLVFAGCPEVPEVKEPEKFPAPERLYIDAYQDFMTIEDGFYVVFITFAWNAVPNAKEYRLYAKPAGADESAKVRMEPLPAVEEKVIAGAYGSTFNRSITITRKVFRQFPWFISGQSYWDIGIQAISNKIEYSDIKWRTEFDYNQY
jgi:hypothetical protein